MKKKWIIVVIASLLLTFILYGTTQAAGNYIDLSKLNDNELISLLDEVTAELMARGIEKTANLSKGKYIAGKDIPVGRYVYTCLAQGDDWGNVTVTAEKGTGELILWEIVEAPKEGENPETVILSLNEGDQLESGVPFSLTIMAGIPFR